MAATFQPLEILGVGMVNAVGLTARTAAAAMRAGVSRLRESPVYGKRSEPHVMGLVGDEYLPPLHPSFEEVASMSSRNRRMLRLGTYALQEAAQFCATPPPLLLSLPEADTGQADPVRAGFINDLAVQAGVALDLSGSKVFRHGRAGGLMLLVEAQRLLANRHIPYVLVGGVDSYLDLALLCRLDLEDRLHQHGVSDGLIPGEGAAFLLLGRQGLAKSMRMTPAARLTSAGVGNEPGHRYSPTPYRGEGLASAFDELFHAARPGTPKIRSVFAGFNGESMSAKEWGVAHLRSMRHFEEDHAIDHPSECIGDAGAAAGPIMLVQAAVDLEQGSRAGPVLVWCSSDREARAAALVQSAS